VQGTKSAPQKRRTPEDPAKRQRGIVATRHSYQIHEQGSIVVKENSTWNERRSLEP
jgi:hypothetical protein